MPEGSTKLIDVSACRSGLTIVLSLTGAQLSPTVHGAVPLGKECGSRGCWNRTLGRPLLRSICASQANAPAAIPPLLWSPERRVL
jgi:hypothetical protein